LINSIRQAVQIIILIAVTSLEIIGVGFPECFRYIAVKQRLNISPYGIFYLIVTDFEGK
jgi:hypothetical protein